MLQQRRLLVTSREPRRRLPVKVLSIKKDMHKLQNEYRVEKQKEYDGFGTFANVLIGTTLVTYVVCFFGCDKDFFVEVVLTLKDMKNAKGSQQQQG